MTISPVSLQQAVHLLKKHNHPYLVAHPRPDGDTLGCTLALRLALIALGKAPIVACVHPVPSNLCYLPDAEAFVQAVPEESAAIAVDLLIAVDMSDLQRTGGMVPESWIGRLPLLVIDHHATNDNFGDVNLVMPEAAATVIPLIALFEALDVSINADIATCLLTGLLTDTRGLRTSSTTPEVLALVSALIEAGGDYMTVVQNALDSVPYRQMRGWGIALNRLQLEDSLAWTTFPIEEKRRLDIRDQDDLSLSNLLSQIAEANIAAAFLEMEDGSVKVSMRARPGYDIALIAKKLGGGGHRQAAGCTLEGPLDAVVERVLPLLREALKREDVSV